MDGARHATRRASLVRRRRYFLALPLLAVGLLVAVVVPALTPLHTAVSALLVESEAAAGAPAADAARTVEQLLHSERLLRHVAGKLGLSAPAPEPGRIASMLERWLPAADVAAAGPDALLERLRRKIRVGDRGGGIAVLAVQDGDPTTALRINRALIDALLEHLAGRRPHGQRASAPVQLGAGLDVADDRGVGATSSDSLDAGIVGDPEVRSLTVRMMAAAAESGWGELEGGPGAVAADVPAGRLRRQLLSRLDSLVSRHAPFAGEATLSLLVRRYELRAMADASAELVAGPLDTPGVAAIALRATLLQPPRLPARDTPVEAIRFGLLGAALVAAIGLAGVLVAEACSLGFETGSEARAVTGLEVVGSLPQLDDAFPWERRRRWQRRLGRAGFALVLAAALVAHFLLWERNALRNRVVMAPPPAAPMGDRGTP